MLDLVSALKRVDLPTLGRPTSPALMLMFLFAFTGYILKGS